MNVHRIGGSCLGLCLVLAATATPGCLNLEKPHPAVTEAKVPLLKTWAKLTAEDGGMPKDNWIATFDDATLQALVIEALVNNRDVRVAAAFRDQSIALAQKAGAPLWPTLDLNAEGLKTFHNAGNNSTAMLLNLSCISWEVDVWGRVRYLTDAAEADVQVAQADLEFMRQSIASQVAQTYCQAIANKQHLANSQAMVVMQEEINRIHQAKLKEGQLGKMDWELSNSDLASFRADAQNRQSAYESSLRALEVLLGRYPPPRSPRRPPSPSSPRPFPPACRRNCWNAALTLSLPSAPLPRLSLTHSRPGPIFCRKLPSPPMPAMPPRRSAIWWIQETPSSAREAVSPSRCLTAGSASRTSSPPRPCNARR